MDDGWFDFGDSQAHADLQFDEWIREVGDDDIVAQLDNPFCIDRGQPKLCERQALLNFFPRLSRGIRCKNGRTILVEPGNDTDPYGPDLVLRCPEHRPNKGLAFIDVERKHRDQLFTSTDLPIHIPVLTMTAHKTGVYRWPDGSWHKSGKMRLFERYPEVTFFLAVGPDHQVGLLVAGTDIVACEPEWVYARNGPPYHENQILVARVPRGRAILGTANQYAIENAIMNSPVVRRRVEHHGTTET